MPRVLKWFKERIANIRRGRYAIMIVWLLFHTFCMNFFLYYWMMNGRHEEWVFTKLFPFIILFGPVSLLAFGLIAKFGNYKR